jgi:hypothetical protein
VTGELDPVPGEDAVCAGLWLPHADGWFVPQGVALDGHTAWVTGYRWRAGYGNRPCRLMHVDLRTGRLLAYQPRLEGAVPGRPRTFCRHGGGVALTDAGLWVAETQRLWLVDPARVGRTGAVRRMWRIEPPVSGGSLIVGATGRFGLADFHRERTSWLYWFDPTDVLRPGVRSVGAEPAGPSRAVALHRTSAPRLAQGGAVDPDGPRGAYLTSSVSTCSMLITPQGRRVAAGPGLEGIAFDGRGGLWAVLESGTRAYQRMGRPLVPMLVRYDLRRLVDGPDADCPW